MSTLVAIVAEMTEKKKQHSKKVSSKAILFLSTSFSGQGNNSKQQSTLTIRN